MIADGGFREESCPTAAALVRHLRDEWTPPSSVKSERILDAEVLSEVRRWIRGRIPGISVLEVKRWVAGHEEERSEKKWWTQSKPHQVVCLWGAGKTSDLFIYHPEGSFGLPPRGISLEIKFVSLNEKTGKAASYAGAIATTAGQLLAYSIRHEWTIGFVWIDGPRRRSAQGSEAHVERSEELVKCLPKNSTLIIRFRG
jgi:hypothetical protein